MHYFASVWVPIEKHRLGLVCRDIRKSVFTSCFRYDQSTSNANLTVSLRFLRKWCSQGIDKLYLLRDFVIFDFCIFISTFLEQGYLYRMHLVDFLTRLNICRRKKVPKCDHIVCFSQDSPNNLNMWVLEKAYLRNVTFKSVITIKQPSATCTPSSVFSTVHRTI